MHERLFPLYIALSGNGSVYLDYVPDGDVIIWFSNDATNHDVTKIGTVRLLLALKLEFFFFLPNF